MQNKNLVERGLPALPAFDKESWPKVRREMVQLLADQEYGHTPEWSGKVWAESLSKGEEFSSRGEEVAGKGTLEEILLHVETPRGEYSFPVQIGLPSGVEKARMFVYISFMNTVPNKYLPAEEILESGVGFAQVCYNDAARDCAEGLRSGLALHFPRKDSHAWGLIGVWAFAASRVMDYLMTRDDVDHDHIAVTGHSRLGKTALWCAAQDERFVMACPNDSGCSGDALSRGHKGEGEQIADITRSFPYWFCDAYKTYAGAEEEQPFDQHYLVASIAPRKVCVGSAQRDLWASPQSQFLCCHAAGEAWEKLGLTGFVAPEDFPNEPCSFPQGNVDYHMRAGTHYMSRTDWAYYIDVLKRL